MSFSLGKVFWSVGYFKPVFLNHKSKKQHGREKGGLTCTDTIFWLLGWLLHLNHGWNGLVRCQFASHFGQAGASWTGWLWCSIGLQPRWWKSIPKSFVAPTFFWTNFYFMTYTEYRHDLSYFYHFLSIHTMSHNCSDDTHTTIWIFEYVHIIYNYSWPTFAVKFCNMRWLEKMYHFCCWSSPEVFFC